MDRISTPRRMVVVAAVLGAVVLGACGGGGAKPASTSTPAAPGANVDPNANGTFTGPINKAKTTATNVNNQQQQLTNTTAGDNP
jgi:ABC-type uncharacterized transport system auxiliary subunit